jgi:hypothetical protein
MARATGSSLKAQRSSSEPPPRATMMTSTSSTAARRRSAAHALHRCGRDQDRHRKSPVGDPDEVAHHRALR